MVSVVVCKINLRLITGIVSADNHSMVIIAKNSKTQNKRYRKLNAFVQVEVNKVKVYVIVVYEVHNDTLSVVFANKTVRHIQDRVQDGTLVMEQVVLGIVFIRGVLDTAKKHYNTKQTNVKVEIITFIVIILVTLAHNVYNLDPQN